MKFFILAFFLTATAFFAQAQIKETNSIELGLDMQNLKGVVSSQYNVKQGQNIYNIGYGRFIQNNVKIGVKLNYGAFSINSSVPSFDFHENAKIYGANLYYQKYYSLLKKFYAFGGGTMGYTYAKARVESTGVLVETDKENFYELQANGGFAWFLSKHIALESTVLSTGLTYQKDEKGSPAAQTTNTSTEFNLSSNTVLNGLNFKILFLF